MGQAVSRVAQYRSMIDRTKQKYKESKTALMREKEQQQETEKTIRRLNQVGQILQVVVSSIQNEVHKEISNIVTRCLQAVFSDDSYTFKIVFEYKRGRTEARLLFERDGQEFDPLSSTGGGVVDVAAFGLRVAAIVLGHPTKRRLLVLDEPFKFLSEQYRPAIRELIEQLAQELQFQFIIVTHIKELEMGDVVVL